MIIINLKYIKLFIIVFLLASGFLYGTDADSLEKKMVDMPPEKRLETLLTLSNYHKQENDKKSIDYGIIALKLAKDLKSKKYIKKAFKNLAEQYYYHRNLEKSLNYYKKLADITGESNEKLIIYKKISQISEEIGNYHSALDFLTQAKNIFGRLDNIEGLAETSRDIGHVYKQMKNYNAALKYFNQAIKYFRRTGNKEGEAQSMNELGRCYFELASGMKTVPAKKPKHDFSSELSSDVGISASIDVKKEEKKKPEEKPESKDSIYKLAIEYFNKSIEEANKGNYRGVLINNYENLSDYFVATGQLEKALELNRQAQAIKDSIYEEAMDKKFIEMSVKYETEKKESELELLREKEKANQAHLKEQKIITYFALTLLVFTVILASITFSRYRLRVKSTTMLDTKNKELEKTNKKLIKSEKSLIELNKTKDKFFSIVAHDLRIPINAFLGITKYLNDRFEQLDDEEIQDSVTDISKSASQLYNLLENLLLWSRSQTDMIEMFKEKIDFYEIAIHSSYENRPAAEKRSINIINKIENGTYGFGDVNMIITILNNLISNAIRFGKIKGKVILRTVRDKDMIGIAVKDDGYGMSREEIDKLFKLDVHNVEIGGGGTKGSGLGLIICKDFLDKNNGKIFVESVLGEGSSFKFLLPVYEGN